MNRGELKPRTAAHPMPLVSDVVGVSATDDSLSSGGPSVTPADILAGGKLALEVRLTASLRAGANGWVSVVLALQRGDGTTVLLDRTRLLRAKPSAETLSSPWVRVPSREAVLSFRLFGRAAGAAGSVSAATMEMRGLRP